MPVNRLFKARRVIVALPFVVALTLNIWALVTDPLHLSRRSIEKYVFLFATPWGWLLDRGWFYSNHKWLERIIGYFLLFWGPAMLYAGCLWLLFTGAAMVKRASSR